MDCGKLGLLFKVAPEEMSTDDEIVFDGICKNGKKEENDESQSTVGARGEATGEQQNSGRCWGMDRPCVYKKSATRMPR